MALLELKGITAGYGQNVILRDFNLNVERGEFVSLLGSSGCGKTTLLRMLAFAPAAPGQVNLSSALAPQARPTEPVAVQVSPAARPEPAPASAPVEPVPSSPVSLAAELAVDLPWAQESEPSAPAAPPTFDGDWRALISQLKLGVAGMLAQHAELVSYDADSISLRVAAEHKAVATRDYQERLRDALSQHFGHPLSLRVDIGDDVADTPAAQTQRERQARQQEAETSIQNDPIVQQLVREFGATVIPDSIKPL